MHKGLRAEIRNAQLDFLVNANNKAENEVKRGERKKGESPNRSLTHFTKKRKVKVRAHAY